MNIIDCTKLNGDNYVLIVSTRSGFFTKKLRFHKIFRASKDTCFDMLTHEDIKDKVVLRVVENHIHALRAISEVYKKTEAESAQSLLSQLMSQPEVRKMMNTRIGPGLSPFAGACASPKSALSDFADEFSKATKFGKTREDAYRAMMMSAK